MAQGEKGRQGPTHGTDLRRETFTKALPKWGLQINQKTKEKNIMKELKDTIEMMNSEDYKERFKAEYYQTKIRYEKLKAFNTKIEAAKRTQYYGQAAVVDMPKHDCPEELLRDQQSAMGNYLHILEVRAQIEGVAL